jgi:small GTP-binding protein
MGSFAVGKTSLIKRFVSSLFDDKYHTTVGVKIDKKNISIKGNELTFVIWDIAGEDDFASFRPIYLRGVAAYIIVIDGTRKKSLDIALNIHQKSQVITKGVPVVFALNKCDLESEWTIEKQHLKTVKELNFPIVKTSAKTGQSVDEIFYQLGLQLLP